MSMSEFERQQNEEGRTAPLSTHWHGHDLPADFSEEDLDFAQELDTLFSVDEEDLPPYFVQTLLEAESPRFRLLEPGFEQKTRARVFRRLNLHPRLFERKRPTFASIVNALPARRMLLTVGAAVMLFMVCTVMMTSQSFALGMDIMLRHSHSGVMQVVRPPTEVRGQSTVQEADASLPAQMTLVGAQQMLHFPMYLPQSIPDDYSLDSLYMYQSTDQSWADGPILELNYTYSEPGVTPDGTGRIAIREFKPKENVFQVVERGAAYPLNVDQMGQAEAIYIDGQWMTHNHFSHVWVFGQRSELIFQRDGIVFWIVGDQRDGMDQSALMNIATSLQALNIDRILHISEHIYSVTQLVGDSTGLFTGDIIAVYPEDNLTGPS
ncbi:MAG TPA: hypothetical protein VFQ30_21570, partial [Ktedonobacteraceae bacterium]|nr:hypothetical protein [Ktedonobacteraceae bacterium]